MSFERFLKKNKIEKKNVFHPATTSLVDEEGNPLLWEIRHISTKENERIQEECTEEVQVTGKYGVYRPKLDLNTYTDKLITAAVVFPDLLNAELQDSYGVTTPEELVKRMIDSPGEYAALAKLIQKMNGFDETLQGKVDKAKN